MTGLGLTDQEHIPQAETDTVYHQLGGHQKQTGATVGA